MNQIVKEKHIIKVIGLCFILAISSCSTNKTIIITDNNIEDLEEFIGKTVTIKGIVENSKIPTIFGVDVTSEEPDLRGQMAQATGILKKTIITEVDPYSANRGTGIFYSIVDTTTNFTVQVQKIDK